VYASLRPYSETAKYGYFSLPRHLSFHYYAQAWDVGLPKFYKNTFLIAVPSVILVLFFASFVAFCLSAVQLPGAKTCSSCSPPATCCRPQVMRHAALLAYTKIPLPEFAAQFADALRHSYG
jgi:multiple sugar transport system permease protein